MDLSEIFYKTVVVNIIQFYSISVGFGRMYVVLFQSLGVGASENLSAC